MTSLRIISTIFFSCAYSTAQGISLNEYLNDLQTHIKVEKTYSEIFSSLWQPFFPTSTQQVRQNLQDIKQRTLDMQRINQEDNVLTAQNRSQTQNLAACIYSIGKKDAIAQHAFIQWAIFFKRNPDLSNLLQRVKPQYSKEQISHPMYTNTHRYLSDDQWDDIESFPLWSQSLQNSGSDFSISIDKNIPLTPGYRRGSGGCILINEHPHSSLSNYTLTLHFSALHLKNPILEEYLQTVLDQINFKQARQVGLLEEAYNAASSHIHATIAAYNTFIEDMDIGLKRDYFYKASYFLSERHANGILQDIVRNSQNEQSITAKRRWQVIQAYTEVIENLIDEEPELTHPHRSSLY